MNIITIAEKTIKEHNLLSNGDRVLVGLSGGADSVALLHVLCVLAKKYDLRLSAAHVNHCLRTTADRDMDFCRRLCGKLNIPFYRKIADIRGGAAKLSQSEELYARNVRYEYFSSLPCDKIATAHNKNDNAETILHNFMRGASSKGLSGIPYSRGKIVRPLLDIKKADIIEFCVKNGYEFMTDETNFESVYTRNKIRLQLIPEIEKTYNSAFTDVICRNAALLREDSDYLENTARALYDGTVQIDSCNMTDNALKRRIIQLHYKKCSKSDVNLPVKYIDDITELMKHGTTGQKIDLPNNFEARIEYGRLIIAKKENKPFFEYAVYPDKPLFIPEIKKNVILRKEVGGGIFLKDTENLSVRCRKNGDCFYPKGMTGKKKLSDYFTDKKIPSSMRNEIPILVKGNEIVAVIGMRVDRRFTDKNDPEYKIEIKELDNAE